MEAKFCRRVDAFSLNCQSLTDFADLIRPGSSYKSKGRTEENNHYCKTSLVLHSDRKYTLHLPIFDSTFKPLFQWHPKT